MSSPALRWITEEEFLALPESTDRVELLDGELILAPSPNYRHQVILRRIIRALEDWTESRPEKITIGMAPLDVRFAPGRILQTDAFVLFAETPCDHQGPIEAERAKDRRAGGGRRVPHVLEPAREHRLQPAPEKGART